MKNSKEKLSTIKAYNVGAESLARKFNLIGPRTKDIKRGLKYIQKQNPKVLEIGCGNGRDAMEITKATNDYTGIDISSEMIKLAKKNVKKGRFKVVDMEKYDFPKNVDVIFAFASLLHLDKTAFKRVLRKVYNSLGQRGVFYLSLKYGHYRKKTIIDDFGNRTYYFYTKTDITKIAKNLFTLKYSNRQTLRGVNWITFILEKR